MVDDEDPEYIFQNALSQHGHPHDFKSSDECESRSTYQFQESKKKLENYF
jgi:hypothetical protein